MEWNIGDRGKPAASAERIGFDPASQRGGWYRIVVDERGVWHLMWFSLADCRELGEVR